MIPPTKVSTPRNYQDALDVVTFRLERLVYALPIEPIQQIIEMVTVTPVPQVRESVEGVINFRGLTIPVVNLRQHLGLPRIPLKLHTPIIVANIAGRLVGLIVDDVVDVTNRSTTEIIRPQDILPQGLGETPLLRGLFQAEGGVILLLDLEHLFQPQQAKALAEAVTALPEEIALPAAEEAAVEAPKPRRKGKKKGAETPVAPGELPVSPEDVA